MLLEELGSGPAPPAPDAGSGRTGGCPGRSYDLYCETWKRTVLNAAGRKKWWKWMAQVEIRQVGRMLRILRRAQHMLDPRAYLAEAQIPLAGNPEEAPEAARRPE